MCTQLNATPARIKAACSRIICPSMNAKTKRRLRFGTTSASNQSRALILSFSAMAIMLVWGCVALTIRSCNYALDLVQIAGVPSIQESFGCLAFNKQCNCLMSSNTTHVRDPCVTRLQFHAMKILPLISLVLEPFAVREFFTLDPDCNRFFIRMAWGASPFVYGAIVIVMFSNHCYHVCLMGLIYATSGILALLGLHELLENRIVAPKKDRAEPTLPLALSPPPQG